MEIKFGSASTKLRSTICLFPLNLHEDVHDLTACPADGEQDEDPAAGPLPVGHAEAGPLPRALAHLPLDGRGGLSTTGDSTSNVNDIEAYYRNESKTF